MSDDKERIAALEATVRHMERTLADVALDVKAMRSKFDKVEGSWRGIVALSGFAGAMGAGLMWVFNFFNNIPK